MFIVGISFGYFLLFSIVLEFLTNMSAVIRNSQSSKVGKSVEIIYFFLVVVSIMITPPDFILDILVIIPLLVLYELSVTISKIAYKKKVVSDASM